MKSQLTVAEKERLLKLAKSFQVEVKAATLPPITPAERGERLPLSFAQQRLWFMVQQRSGASRAYHLSYAWRLKGPLDREALRLTLDRIVARHETLRTTFASIEGEPVQRITPPEVSSFQLLEHDLNEESDAPEKLDRLVCEEDAAEFDLEQGPLIRGRLIRNGEAEQVLLITMHHIVSDGWSIGVFIRELSALYGAYVRGEGDPLAALAVQYADYAVWQRQWMAGERLRQQAAYWERALAGAPALLELPTDHVRPAKQEYAGEWVRIALGENLSRGLKELSKRQGATLYMTLLAGWGALLSRLTGQEDIVIGTPVANRGQIETEGLIGFFINMLALRLDVSGSPSTDELLKRVKEQTLAAQQHQDLPFEQVVEIVRPVRSLAHTPLFQVLFVWQQKVGRGEMALPGVALEPLGSSTQVVAKFDLTLSFHDAGEQIVGGLEYATALFERSTVERYLGYLRALLEAMVADSTQAIDGLPLLGEAERQQLLNKWNATAAEYPREKCVHELFEAQVQQTPEAWAVAYGDQRLTYRELNTKSERLARYLAEAGVEIESRVGIYLRRSPEMLIGVLGVMKAGGAYVPLQPGLPQQRLEHMLRDAEIEWVLVDSASVGDLPLGGIDVVVMDGAGSDPRWLEGMAGSSPRETEARLTPENLAYILYTSGSTGVPKGVMATHRGLSNYLAYAAANYLGPEIRGSVVSSPLIFDATLTTLLPPLLVGKVVELLPEDETTMSRLAERLFGGEEGWLFKITPAHLEALEYVERPREVGFAPHGVVVGGEQLSSQRLRRWKRDLLPAATFVNEYGPTEAVVGCCVWTISDGRGLAELDGLAATPIGRPINNTQLYVLGEGRQLQPCNSVGELYIGGEGLARGYLNQEGLTQERFVTNSFAEVKGGRLYKTGDLARWLPSGALVFVGRRDDQIKLRGYRIELGEIEAHLAEHEGVREAVVIAYEDTAGDRRLVAYYTGETNGGGKDEVGPEQLREHLLARLPEYMVPAAYVRLEKLPLTANGKVDRKALPAPEGDAYGVRRYEEPVGEIETALAGVWAELLKLERVGRYDNFFELGGTSLLVLRVIARMRQLGWPVDLQAMFATPELCELASAICLQTDSVEVKVPPNMIPLSCEAIRPEMLPLVRLTPDEIQRIVETVPGGAANVQDIYPLAPLQEGILFHYLIGGDGDPYLAAQLLAFDNRARLDHYLTAVQAVIDRHDILRTGVVWEGLSEPVQVVWRKASLAVEEVRLEAAAGDAAQQLYQRYNPRSYRIDMRQAPLLRVVITQDEGKDRWLMLLLRHHMVGDHVTMEVMREEIEAFLLGRGDQLAAALPFRNLVAQARLGISQEEHEAFFGRLLADVDEPTAPFGLLNVQGDGTEINQAFMEVEAGLGRRMKERARKLGVSAASLCHVAWAQVAGRASGREDVVFGTVLFGRMQGGEGADRVMGLFMNTLPVRIKVAENGAEESVRAAHKQLAELLRHEHASLALAQRCSAVPAPTPLFSSLLNYRHSSGSAMTRSERKARAWEGIHGLQGDERTNYPVSLDVDDLVEGFQIKMQVDASLNAKRVCRYMHTALGSLVDALEREPARPLRTLEVMPEEERRQVLYEWNATAAEYPRAQSLHELFEAQVERTPEAAAVAFEDATLTYAELNRRANQLAHYLRELGIGPDRRVAICAERGLGMTVGLLGVFKAGGAYIPLDPAYPLERLRYMVDDSAPAVVLTQGRWRRLFAGVSEELPLLELDAPAPQWLGQPDWDLTTDGIGGISRRLAYVIYTSGSTGVPKGAMVEQGGMVNHLYIMIRDLCLTEQDVVAQTASQCFDISVWQFLAALLVGGKVLIVGDQEAHHPEGLLQILERGGVTIWETVPSMMEAMVEEGREIGVGLENIRWAVVTGEACPVGLCRRWKSLYPAMPLLNAYGPAECSDDVSFYVMGEGWSGEDATQVPIGRPLMNMQVYVLDGRGEPAPVGVTGELYVGGEGVGRGYWNRAELTADRFIADRFSGREGGRLYQTGDLARWVRDGNLEFFGRIDHQVKIRGYRIELGEIEARLAEYEGVQEAVVIAREDTHGDKRLVAYFTATETDQEEGGGREQRLEAVGAQALREHLLAKLPEYMVPAAYVRLEKLPLTPNGKVDRKALPAPEGEAYGVRGYEEPLGETETALAGIWAMLLKLERVGRHDNFFELGGHSLLVVRLISQLRKVLNSEVMIRDVFERPVLSDLAAAVQGAARATLPPITPAQRGEHLPSSFAQQRLWFLAQIGASKAYHVFDGWRLKGPLDREALRRALDRIVARHEVLRTTFVAVEGEPVQRIAAAKASRFHLDEQDLTNRIDAQEALERLVKEEAAAGFDMERGPLIRGRLIRNGEAEQVLLITMHHIVSDGWSQGILVNELSALYGAFVRGEGDPLAALAVQYADYAVWQRQWMAGEILRQQAEYWERALAGVPALLELPTDHVRPAEQEYAGGRVPVALEERLSRGLKELSKRQGATLYMTLLAGWGALLSRLTGQEDIVIGTPVANRGQIETEGLIGFFVNMLALRLDVSGSPSTDELLKRVKERALDGQQHQDLPFEQVVEIVRPVRSLAHTPLFQVMFDWQQNVGEGRLALPGLQFGPLGSAAQVVAQFDLTLSLAEESGRIVGNLKYATSLFERATAERYAGYLRALLEAMVADSTQAVDGLPLLGEAERQQLLNEWNATAAEYPRAQGLHELFEEQVERTPEAAAVAFEDAILSYGGLNRRANQLSHHLKGLGVGPDIRVAICVERGLEMMVGLLAVLKAGGAYVPLDPAYPMERLRLMVEDSSPRVVLTEGHLEGLFSGIGESLPVLDLCETMPPWREQPETNPDHAAAGLRPEHLAYVIYTSGSTGIPKGVMIPYFALTNFLHHMRREPGIEPDDIVLATTTLSFDIAGLELYLPLIVGAHLRIVGREVMLDGIRLQKELKSGVTIMQATPTSWQMLVESGWEGTDGLKVVCGGEALTPDLAKQLVHRSDSTWNMYGPTEATIWSLMEKLESVGDRVALGKPIANTQIYILDRHGEPTLVGVTGELYIAGSGVARGYLNRADLTAERFVGNPFVMDAGARMYRTGDLGRWRGDGTIEFLGRNDFQIKMRGRRIELGEIETRLAEHEAVREAVVIVRQDTVGDQRLVAYYTGADLDGGEEEGARAEQLRKQLRAKLPEYMVPAAYVRLEKLPLTLNGKVDRKALPAPEGEAYGVRGYEEPLGEVETALAEVWAMLLKLERVGRHDNFFELGGNSLVAMRLVQRMRQVGLQIDVRALFATPVLSELASGIHLESGAVDIEVPPNLIPPGCDAITPEMLPLVELTAEEIERIVGVVLGGAANVQDIYPLAPLQEGLLFHHLMGGEGDAYVVASTYSFDSRARLDSYLNAMQAVIDRHDILRTGVVWEGVAEPVQVVWRKAILPVEEAVLEKGAGDPAEQLYLRYNPRSYRIDVRQAPLLRVVIAHDEENSRWLMLKLLHHLAGDLTTSAIMREEIQAYLLGEEAGLAVPLPFRNQIARARLGVSQQEHETYFRQLLGDVAEPTAPFGLLDVHGDGTRTEWARINVETGLARRMRERARKLGVSAATLCHVAWAQVVARASAREDVVFGTVLFGRMQGGEDADRAMGVFINTLPVRIRLGEHGAEEIVRMTHRQLAELFRHEHASLALAQRCSAVPAPTPLFSSLLNYLYRGGGRQVQSEERLHAWEGIEDLYGESRNNYPVHLAVSDLGEDFKLTAHVDASIDPRRVCQQMHTALGSLVDALEREPARPLRNLEVMPKEEWRQVLYEWNATAAEYPREKCVHELFEAQVERTPEAAAVAFEDATLSYGELNRRANRLAHYLQAVGIGPDARVAICVERGVEMIVGLLAVLKAGGAYVPLDPAYPTERLTYMLEHSAPAVLLTQRKLQPQFDRIGETLRIIDITEREPQLNILPETNLDRATLGLCPEHLAYIIYTSGSTGLSKGVMVRHQSVVNLFFGLKSSIHNTLGAGYLRVSVNGPLAFDTSVKQIIQLLDGHVLDIVPEGVRIDGEALMRFVRDRNIEVFDCTPSQLRLLLDAGLVRETDDSHLEGRLLEAGLLPENVDSLRLVLMGGESIAKTMWETLASSQIKFFNVYGPTECTVDASVCEVRPGFEPSIGRPIANTALYVLDGNLNPVPCGAPSELYIGGQGVTRGYWSDPETTARKFIPDPFGSAPGLRLYRTGDRVRRLSNGNLAFLGRMDDQVKVRGFRIEPNEITSVLEQHPAVRQAAVVLHPNPDNPQFVAYVALDPMRSPSVAGRQRYKLPNNLAIVHLNRNETDFLYEEMFEVQAYFKHGIVIGDGDCVFDVGANIGLFSLAAHLRAKNIQVYAFEPSPSVFDLLKTNMQLYSVNARLYHAGLSRVQGAMPMTFYPKFSFLSGIYANREEDKEVVRSFVRKHGTNGMEGRDSELLEELLEDRFESHEIEVNLLTLSDILRKNNIGHIDLLKINVEKSEMDVMAGIEEEDWPKIRQIALEVHDIEGRLNSILELLRRHDYEVAVEQDWQLEESSKTNFYVYARRAAEHHVVKRASPTLLADQMVTAQELRSFMAKRLPEYMVPVAYVPLDVLPLTPNGKLDRKKLPAPRGDAYAVTGYEAPVGVIETVLAEIWGKAFQLERVGRRDNFFELGGHSLLAVRMVNLLEQADIKVVVMDFFTHPTIESLAAKVGLAGKQRAVDAAICVREGGAERPLFLVHPSIHGLYARRLAQYLDDGIPVYSVPPKALSENSDRTNEGIAVRMVQMIRSVQPEGPYRIGGYSSGGPLAYEIAAQLIGADQRVEFLGLFDAYYRGGAGLDAAAVAVAVGIEFDDHQSLLRMVEDAFAAANNDLPITQEVVDQLRLSATTMDFEALMRKCQDMHVLPIDYQDFTPAQMRQWFAHERANMLADIQYCAQPLPIPVHFFAAREYQATSPEPPVEAWKTVVPPGLLRIIPIGGTHSTVMKSPHVEEFGRLLSNAIRQAAEGSSEVSGLAYSPLVALQSGRRYNVHHFWVPGAGAPVTGFAELIAGLDKTMPVYGLQPRGLDGDLVPHSTVQAAAEFYVKAINEVYLRGSVHLLGHSFGGWVALQMAHLLLESGRTITSLTVLDKEAPDQVDGVVREYSHTDILMNWVEDVELVLGHPLGIGRRDIESRPEAAQRELLYRRLVTANLMPLRSGPDLLRGPLRTFAASIRAHYKPEKPYLGPFKLILVDDPRLDEASNRRYRQKVAEEWKRFAPNLVCAHGPGNHLTMLKRPNAQAIANLFRDDLLRMPAATSWPKRAIQPPPVGTGEEILEA